MTLDGTFNKTGILLLLCFITAAVSWNNPNPVLTYTGLGVGFVTALITSFKPTLAHTTAQIYAFTLGLLLGGITVMFEAAYPGIAIQAIGFIHSNGLMGIGFSLFVVGIAALNLVLDFDFIEQGSEGGLPKHMEWFGAFSLMVTLVWLYLEILRLLVELRRG